MTTGVGRTLSMRIFTDMAFLPLSTSFFEKGALAMGLAPKEATVLTLAAEEIFVYLCRNSSPDQPLDLRCQDGKYYVQAEFSFPLKDIQLRFFNVTASISPDDEAALEQMGLLIASRFVDGLQVKKEPGHDILLSLTKEKAYPASLGGAPPALSFSQCSIRKADPEELKILAQCVHSFYPGWLLPDFFRFPGKLVDMVASAQYEAALSFDPKGHVTGGIIWYWASRKTVGCWGPYLLGKDPGSSVPEELLDACLGAVGKTYAVGLVNTFPTEQLPREHFEVLGTLTHYDEDGIGTPVTACFRQLHEDPGASSWSHPDVEQFLREQYDRLVLPRELLPVRDHGETGNPFSVLSAHFDRTRKKVTLRPLQPGKDAEENLVDHLKLFKKEKIYNVFFEMDLGIPWQAVFTPGLLRSGFTPRIVIPYGGDGDRVLFQLGI